MLRKSTETMRSRVWKLVFMTLLLCGSLVRLGEADTIFVCETGDMDTSISGGFGSDCAAALSDLEADTRAEAQAVCHSLGYDRMCFNGSFITITKDCAWNDNHQAYKVKAFRTYQCGNFYYTEN